jgi:hypothetical protein
VWAFTSRLADEGLTNDLKQQAFPELPVEMIAVGPLSSDEITTMARDRLNRLPSEDLRQLLDGAGGNPFFASQILDGVVCGPGTDDALSIPARFILSVRHRIAEVDAGAVDLVRVAAVFGKPLAVEDAEALLADVSCAAVTRRLETLEQADLLRSDSSGRAAFAHDLVREAVYADLTDRTRRSPHQRCARYLASAGGDSLTAAAHAQAAITPGDEATADLLLRSADEVVGAMPETATDPALTLSTRCGLTSSYGGPQGCAAWNCLAWYSAATRRSRSQGSCSRRPTMPTPSARSRSLRHEHSG